MGFIQRLLKKTAIVSAAFLGALIPAGVHASHARATACSAAK